MLLIITTSAALVLCSLSALQTLHSHCGDILGHVLEIIIFTGIVRVSVLLLLRTASWKLIPASWKLRKCNSVFSGSEANIFLSYFKISQLSGDQGLEQS